MRAVQVWVACCLALRFTNSAYLCRLSSRILANGLGRGILSHGLDLQLLPRMYSDSLRLQFTMVAQGNVCNGYRTATAGMLGVACRYMRVVDSYDHCASRSALRLFRMHMTGYRSPRLTNSVPWPKILHSSAVTLVEILIGPTMHIHTCDKSTRP